MYGSFASPEHRRRFLALSRVTNFLSSFAVFSAVIVVSLPDYLALVPLHGDDAIVPACGDQFKETVKQVAEFSIGLFFACLFTTQVFLNLLALFDPFLVL